MDLGCGTTLDIFTHALHGSLFFFYLFFFFKYINITTYIDKIQMDDLEEGYKVIRSVKEMIMLYKINCYTIR